MSADQTRVIQDALESSEQPTIDHLADIVEREEVVSIAVAHPTGRRWLGGLPDLTADIAGRLLNFEDDFRTSRRDTTLGNVVSTASVADIVGHATAIAAGSAASLLWERLSRDPEGIMGVAMSVVSSDDTTAAENTIYLLILDPIDPYGLGNDRRAAIAEAGLRSRATAVRTLAAEYLFDHNSAVLADAVEQLVRDEDERVRGLAWSAGFRSDPRTTFDLSTSVLGDEHQPLPARRSALAAIGTHLPTSDVVEILSYFVAHPVEELALDAGNLLYRLHRHPTIATAAVESPHQSVREIGAFLLDPYRGSPAAGGSRPGDPTRSDIFAELMRQTEERALSEDAESDPESR